MTYYNAVDAQKFPFSSNAIMFLLQFPLTHHLQRYYPS